MKLPFRWKFCPLPSAYCRRLTTRPPAGPMNFSKSPTATSGTIRPKHIPNRRLDEDFRSRSIFGDVKNVLKYL